jgi:hypothetical protein
VKITLPDIQAFRDRHGKSRYYFRKPGYKRIPLPGSPGSPEFMAAHSAALAGFEIGRSDIGANRSTPGIVRTAVAAYYCDP